MSLHDLELCTCGHPRHEHGRDGYPEHRDRAPGCTGPVPGGGGSAKCPCTGYAEKRRAAPRPCNEEEGAWGVCNLTHPPIVWGRGMLAVDPEQGCGGVVVKVTEAHLTLAVESCESVGGGIDLIEVPVERATLDTATYVAEAGTSYPPIFDFPDTPAPAFKAPGPPPHFFWRHAADTPIPEPEGYRALLVWERDAECSEASDVLRLDWNRREYTGGWTGSNVYLIAGARPDDLYWTWADGDPWTRRSPEARTAAKEAHYRTQYGASTAYIAALVRGDDPHLTMVPLPRNPGIACDGIDPRGGPCCLEAGHGGDCGAWRAHKPVTGRNPSAVPDWRSAGPGPDEYVDDHAACGPECERCADLRKEEGYRERLRAVAEEYGFADVLARWVGGAG
jgi:hypothetical protein